jgi:alanyl-tRNA synthetase
MASERLWYDDAYTRAFPAHVVAHGAHEGRPAVELAATYFYPEGGGQLADRGHLGDVLVLDVQADEAGRVWHVVERDLGGDALPAALDWPRRFDHMQQHTGQHVLSAAFERVLGAPTLSSTLGAAKSVIEVRLGDVDWRALERVEQAANGVVWDDRPVQRHWTDAEGARAFALRKAPAVAGRIRIVEIPEWDLSACGGTHTARTGEVGVIKVVRWERVRGNLRFEFLCGGRALRDHAWRTETLLEAARRRTLAERDLIEHLERAAAERDTLRRQVEELTTRLVGGEARALAGDPPHAVARWDEERTREALRALVFACLGAGAPWVVAAAGRPDPVVMLARAKGGCADLRALLPGLLERAHGKGGGGADFVQVAAADPAAAEAAWRWASAAVAGHLGQPQ